MDNTTYYQRNRDKSMNDAKEYCKNNKEKTKKARNKYRNLSEEDNYLKKIRIKRGNTEKIDIIICLKKRSKN